MPALLTRAISSGRRQLAARFRRRTLCVQTPVPLVSFSFDDAPQSAFDAAGDILDAYGARGTYFVCMGLLGRQTEVGRIATSDHLERAVRSGHELGCHTFDHLDAWHTRRRAFIASVDANRRALEGCLPGYSFKTFAYPKSGARLGVKAELEERFGLILEMRNQEAVKSIPVADAGDDAESSDVARRLEQWREFLRDESSHDGDDLPKN